MDLLGICLLLAKCQFRKLLFSVNSGNYAKFHYCENIAFEFEQNDCTDLDIFFKIIIYKAIDKKALDKYMYGFLGVLFTFGTLPFLNDVIFRKFPKLNKGENIIFISYN